MYNSEIYNLSLVTFHVYDHKYVTRNLINGIIYEFHQYSLNISQKSKHLLKTNKLYHYSKYNNIS